MVNRVYRDTFRDYAETWYRWKKRTILKSIHSNTEQAVIAKPRFPSLGNMVKLLNANEDRLIPFQCVTLSVNCIALVIIASFALFNLLAHSISSKLPFSAHDLKIAAIAAGSSMGGLIIFIFTICALHDCGTKRIEAKGPKAHPNHGNL